MDVDFENILDHLENDANYQPFPSMMHALLFMLVNSPRPIVCIMIIVLSLLLLTRVKPISDLFFHLQKVQSIFTQS